MTQANSLLFNFQMKSPCYLVILSLESLDFQISEAICHFSAFGALIILSCSQCPLCSLIIVSISKGES